MLTRSFPPASDLLYSPPLLQVFSGLLVGAMLPYWFSAMTMKSVGKAALAMVEEVRRQGARFCVVGRRGVVLLVCPAQRNSFCNSLRCKQHAFSHSRTNLLGYQRSAPCSLLPISTS